MRIKSFTVGEKQITRDLVKGKYRKFAKENHPDKNNGSNESEEKFKVGLEHYELLEKVFDGEKNINLFWGDVMKALIFFQIVTENIQNTRRNTASSFGNNQNDTFSGAYSHTRDADRDFTKQTKENDTIDVHKITNEMLNNVDSADAQNILVNVMEAQNINSLTFLYINTKEPKITLANRIAEVAPEKITNEMLNNVGLSDAQNILVNVMEAQNINSFTFSYINTKEPKITLANRIAEVAPEKITNEMLNNVDSADAQNILVNVMEAQNTKKG